jgi:hypothetical protein
VFSAEGANIVTDYSSNVIISAVLNIVAKGSFTIFVQRIHDRYIGEQTLMETPQKRSHEVHDALARAARLGPACAVESMVKEMQRQENALNYVRNVLPLQDDAKAAAKFLADGTSIADTTTGLAQHGIWTEDCMGRNEDVTKDGSFRSGDVSPRILRRLRTGQCATQPAQGSTSNDKVWDTAAQYADDVEPRTALAAYKCVQTHGAENGAGTHPSPPAVPTSGTSDAGLYGSSETSSPQLTWSVPPAASMRPGIDLVNSHLTENVMATPPMHKDQVYDRRIGLNSLTAHTPDAVQTHHQPAPAPNAAGQQVLGKAVDHTNAILVDSYTGQVLERPIGFQVPGHATQGIDLQMLPAQPRATPIPSRRVLQTDITR